MKKIIILVLIVLMYLFYYKEYNILDDSIRFRVIANSNSMEDTIMKEKVVDELSTIIFKNNDSITDAENNIYNNLKNIEDKIKRNEELIDRSVTYGFRSLIIKCADILDNSNFKKSYNGLGYNFYIKKEHMT